MADIEISKLKSSFSRFKNEEQDEDFRIRFEKLKMSIRMFGPLIPILVRKKKGEYEIIDGHWRWKAMKELGYKKVEVKCVGEVSNENAIEMALSLAEIRMPLDYIKIAKLIKRLKNDGDLGHLPYTPKEIQDKLDILEYPWELMGRPEKPEEEKQQSLL